MSGAAVSAGHWCTTLLMRSQCVVNRTAERPSRSSSGEERRRPRPEHGRAATYLPRDGASHREVPLRDFDLRRVPNVRCHASFLEAPPPCPSRAPSTGKPLGTTVATRQHPRQRPPTNFPGRGPSCLLSAEAVGFEPTVRGYLTTVFKSVKRSLHKPWLGVVSTTKRCLLAHAWPMGLEGDPWGLGEGQPQRQGKWRRQSCEPGSCRRRWFCAYRNSSGYRYRRAILHA